MFSNYWRKNYLTFLYFKSAECYCVKNFPTNPLVPREDCSPSDYEVIFIPTNIHTYISFLGIDVYINCTNYMIHF